ncbi:hypothetical protein [Neotamlana laminarinivorans]|uniref:Uncharacterized protein n=1 Tax=Neotamlana laminarinivorans TaxID=2883124 RepID=A0A9X1HYE0_9FLAO|nr:hypothetical protein [Tamlana laminarinivorans]MCB4798409.1 hypothetical protein [Tamlana laminarinivorans]
MKKTILLSVFTFTLITSCKTGVENRDVELCNLFEIGNFSFYSPSVYEHPILFSKGTHDLLHDEYVPAWYSGYCALNKPSHFKSKEDFMKYIHSSNIELHGKEYYEKMYDHYKDNPVGVEGYNHKDFHLLFRGTVSVKNSRSGNEYLLVAGKNYIEKEEDIDKNTDFYERNVENMLAFALEDGVYKAVDLQLVNGTFTKAQDEKVFAILNVDNLINSTCFQNINTLKKPNFNNSDLPKWVYNKSALDEE